MITTIVFRMTAVYMLIYIVNYLQILLDFKGIDHLLQAPIERKKIDLGPLKKANVPVFFIVGIVFLLNAI